MEPQLKDVVVELTPKPPLVAVLPLSVDDLEGDVLVRRPRGHPQDTILSVINRQQLELWCGSLVDQIWVENVELVSLNYLWRRVVEVVVSLVVFVPFEASVNSVEISRFPKEDWSYQTSVSARLTNIYLGLYLTLHS